VRREGCVGPSTVLQAHMLWKWPAPSPSAADPNPSTVAVFASVAAATIACALIVLQSGFPGYGVGSVLRLLGIAWLVVNVGLLRAVRDVLPLPAASAVMALGTLALLGFLPISVTPWVGSAAAATGAVLFGLNAREWMARTSGGKTPFLVFATLFGAWLASCAWGNGFHDPVFEETLLLGVTNQDILYHAAIANMLQATGIPSTGLDGVPFLPYHVGSHWLFGQLGALADLGVLRAYNEAYPVIVIPATVAAILQVAAQVRTCWTLASTPAARIAFWCVATVGFVGAFPRNAGRELVSVGWHSFVGSESYSIALLVAFGVLSVVIAWVRQIDRLPPPHHLFCAVFVCLATTFCGWSKISIQLLLVAGLSWGALRVPRLRTPLVLGTLGFCLATFTALYTVFSMGKYGHLGVLPFAFLRQYLNAEWALWFFVLQTAWVLAYAAIRLHGRTLDELRSAARTGGIVDLEALVIVALIGFGPAMILDIPGRSALFFFEFQKWVGLALVLGWVASREWHPIPWRERSAVVLVPAVLAAVVAVSVMYNAGYTVARTAVHNLRTRFVLSGTAIENFPGDVVSSLAAGKPLSPIRPSRSPNWQALDGLRHLRAERPEGLLWIPRDHAFWSWHDKEFINAMIAPAVAGFPLVGGLPSDVEEIQMYGFFLYHGAPIVASEEDARRHALELGVDAIVTLPGSIAE